MGMFGFSREDFIEGIEFAGAATYLDAVSYTHLRAHETRGNLVCRLLLEKNNESVIGSYFYSDSHNDLPLLELVDNPMAVNSDEILTSTAHENGWQVFDWR